MAKVMKIFTTIRSHWKKSTFAAGVVAYGISYYHEKYQINQLMRTVCAEACKYGDIPQPVHSKTKNILVLVNPVANKRSSFKNFEEYSEPLLHLAGISIEIVKTDSEGHARRYLETLDHLPDAVLIAGGDGTICEAITGLLRRSSFVNCPIGIIPIGRTNSVGSQLFRQQNTSNKFKNVEMIVNATMSIVRGKITAKDVMKIEILQNENEPTEAAHNPKPIYAIGSLHWGAYRDALTRRDKYWYFGPLRDYATFLFNAFDSTLTWNCQSKLSYTDPCAGCSNCYIKPFTIKTENRRWWSMFIPQFKPKTSQIIVEPDLSKIKNENCHNRTEMYVNPSEMIVENNFNRTPDDIPKLIVKFGPETVGRFDFIANSWNRLKQIEINYLETNINARLLDILPTTVYTDDKEIFFSIDNEAFEVKPIRISVIPKAIQLFTM